MKKVKICDLTLREAAKTARAELSFKEKLEVAKLIDGVGADIIETEEFSGSKADVLFLHTISTIIKSSTVSCPVKLNVNSVEQAWEAIKKARYPRLHVMIPTSTVQMEYIAHKKPAAVLDLITELVSKAKSLCSDVEFSAMDATRSEKDFLVKAVKAAVDAGATTVTLCDSVGTMLPGEVSAFIKDSFESVDMTQFTAGVEFSNTTGLGAACAISALDAGVSQIKVAVGIDNIPSLDAAAEVFRLRGEALGYESSLNHTRLSCACSQIRAMIHPEKKQSTVTREMDADFVLNKEDDIQTVAGYVEKLGYEPDGDEMAQIFENFQRLSQKKPIGARELDAIIAGASLQSAPVYRLKSYVINTANLFSSSAQITLSKDNSELCGISMGDGPIDAAFVAIESIIGHHYELDDFQIRSVTEGREAMGEAIVKLRHSGKLYSGRGLSTDIVGSSIHAYINALNKICSEEA
ncbi:MAG: hypothetical protein E7646_02065 [Ruminococcaceae bacterium]|nr:hypothetical protein [Oscillospiraceae bacterium]